MLRRSLATRLARAVAFGVLVLAALPAGASAGGAPLLDGWRPAPQPVVVHASAFHDAPARHSIDQRRAPAATTPAASDPCTDRAKSFTGGHWQETFRWSFRVRSTPEDLSRSATITALKRAVGNITGARNDCGRADRVPATASYLGTSDRRPAPTDGGTCASRDGVNVVGFGRLPTGIAGLTCVWSIGDRIVEADIKLDRRARWSTSLGDCSFASMVEAVATHEFGHAFGLGHVSEARHGRLTMSEQLDGFCQNGESTLGLGDMLGLEQLY